MNTQSPRRPFQMHLSTLMLWFVIVGLALGWSIDHFANAPPPRMLPRGPNSDAIYERFGNPDRIYGSGFLFLDYDLSNGQTVHFTVSNEINHVAVTKTPKKR